MGFWDVVKDVAVPTMPWDFDWGARDNPPAASGAPRDPAVQAAPPISDLPGTNANFPGGVAASSGGRGGLYGLSGGLGEATVLIPGYQGSSLTVVPTRIDTYIDSLYEHAVPASIARLQRQLKSQGFYGKDRYVEGKLDDNTLSALKGALVIAARASIDGHTTLADILNGTADTSAGQGMAGAAGAEAFTGTKTQESVVLSTSGDAQATLQSAMSQLLGRRATDAEVSRFHKTLNKAEKKNPVVTSTTYDEGTPTDSLTSGGVSADAMNVMAQDDVFENNGEEYAGVAKDDFTNAFERLIFGG